MSQADELPPEETRVAASLPLRPPVVSQEVPGVPPLGETRCVI